MEYFEDLATLSESLRKPMWVGLTPYALQSFNLRQLEETVEQQKTLFLFMYLVSLVDRIPVPRTNTDSFEISYVLKERYIVASNFTHYLWQQCCLQHPTTLLQASSILDLMEWYST